MLGAHNGLLPIAASAAQAEAGRWQIKMTILSTFEDHPFIARLLESGYDVSLGGGAGERAWVTVCDEGGGLIMFEKGELNARQVIEKLERYAKELLDDGMRNDEINGVRKRIWSD